MKSTSLFLAAAILSAVLLQPAAAAQRSRPIMTPAQANPVYNPNASEGKNPLFESSLRLTVQTEQEEGFGNDIFIQWETWDAKQMIFIERHKVIHRDLAARSFIQVVDLYSTADGLDISVNRGPRQTISLDGTYDPKNSRLTTIFRITPKNPFSNPILSTQAFVNNVPAPVITVDPRV